jgi:hypothetical protein
MIIIKFITMCSLVLFNGISCFLQDDCFKYLGQAEPRDTPKVIHLPVNEGIPAERIAISSDDKEIYFTEIIGYGLNSIHRINYFKHNGNIWNGSFLLCEKCDCPLLSPDNNIIFYGYYPKRTDNGWTSPTMFLENRKVHFLQSTNPGNYYFLSFVNNIATDVFKVIFSQQETIIEPLGFDMKSSVPNDHYIDPDETFILLSLNRQEIKCYGNKDIFIRFRTDQGWSKPINLGNRINTEQAVTKYGMYMSNDKKYMFYTQGNEKIHCGYIGSGLMNYLRN